jgi:hypothetical protein
MANLLDTISGWFRRGERPVETELAGGTPATVGPPGTDTDAETSTNAQVEGASDEPWSGSH